MAEILLENVNKRFGKVEVIKNANLKINDKEFMVLVGPSGCGKTTLLRMIAGLEDISSGNIYIEGKLVNNVPPKNRDIAMVFQNYALYPHMTVYQNMSFALKVRKISKDVIDRKVNEVAEMLGLAELLDRKPKQLSGGQRQRVALGRAVVRDPKVFLMDEPLSNLDAKLRVQTRSELKQLHDRIQTTFIYVTHDQIEAMTMGDRLVIMNKGVIHQVGTPLELYNNPVNRFVAGFIGSPSMNFMKCRLIRDNRNYAFTDGEFYLSVRNEKISDELKKYENKDVIMGIRPEDISIASENDSANSTIKAVIDAVEYLGSETFIYTKIGGARIGLKINSGGFVATGETVTLYFDMTKAHIFDKESDKNITNFKDNVI